MKISDLTILNITSFFKSQQYLLPVMLLFYNQNGLDVSDFLLFQGIVCLAELLLGVPCGWLADSFQKKYVLLLSYFMLLIRYSLWFFFSGYLVILAGELCYAFYKSLFQSSAEGYIYQYLQNKGTEAENLKKYGKFNFATSVGSGVSALLGALIFKEIGVDVVLAIQIFIIIFSIVLLSTIKPLPENNSFQTAEKERYTSFFDLWKHLKGTNLKFYIITNGWLAAFSLLFVNTFQPLMQQSHLPVIIFGIVYFFNHLSRAFSSWFADKIITLLGLRQLSLIIWGTMFSEFVIMYALIRFNLSIITLPLLICVCVSIAMQLCFSVGVTSHLQEHSLKECFSKIASINNTSIRLGTGVMLFLSSQVVETYGILNEPILGLVLLLPVIFFIFRLERKKS